MTKNKIGDFMRNILFSSLLITLILLTSCSVKQETTSDNQNTFDTNKLTNEYLVLVNKDHPQDKNYIPNNLTVVHTVDFIKRDNEIMYLEQKTFESYLNLYNDALNHNLKLTIFSGYRSYEKQTTIWNKNPNEYYVAKPGYSEHQTGLALDISRRDIGLTTNFMNTEEYTYLLNNAHKFGFINRYPINKEQITGYLFEPWHFRYVGIDVATTIYTNNLTLEEYLS